MSSNRRKWRWVVGLALVLATLFLARFFTRTIAVTTGELPTHTLPDGSRMRLNVNSHASYQPFWWWASPKVHLEGEAYFEVASEDSLGVWFGEGNAMAHGAHFFMNSKGTPYTVWSDSGTVVVTDEGRSHVVSEGEYHRAGAESLAYLSNTHEDWQAPTWHHNRFIYITTPMEQVLTDMERVYGVRLELVGIDTENLAYTGLFEQSVTAAEAVKILCYSFGWTYEPIATDHYVIREGEK